MECQGDSQFQFIFFYFLKVTISIIPHWPVRTTSCDFLKQNQAGLREVVNKFCLFEFFYSTYRTIWLKTYLARKSLNLLNQVLWSCLLGQSEMYVQTFSISVTLLFFSFGDIAQILPEYIKLTTQHKHTGGT